MKRKPQIFVLMVVMVGMLACKDKKSTKAEINVNPGTLADPSAYAARHAQRGNAVNPGDSNAPNTDPQAKDPLPLSKNKERTEANTNPIFENPSLTQAFNTYIDCGIDDPKMEGILDKLKAEELSAEDLKTVMNQYFAVIENTDPALLEALSLNDRLKSIFNLYSNVNFQSSIKGRITTPEALEDFSPEELKIITPIQYATQVYDKLTKKTSPWPAAYSSTDSRDGKKYRTVILGQIDFSKGKSKKSLTHEDLAKVEAIGAIWSAYLGSTYRLEGITPRIVGFADRDSPQNAEKNMERGLARAQMVYDAYSKIDASQTFKVESMGDAYPQFEKLPNSPSNRRVDFFLFHRPIEIKQMGVPAHDHSEGEAAK